MELDSTYEPDVENCLSERFGKLDNHSLTQAILEIIKKDLK